MSPCILAGRLSVPAAKLSAFYDEIMSECVSKCHGATSGDWERRVHEPSVASPSGAVLKRARTEAASAPVDEPKPTRDDREYEAPLASGSKIQAPSAGKKRPRADQAAWTAEQELRRTTKMKASARARQLESAIQAETLHLEQKDGGYVPSSSSSSSSSSGESPEERLKGIAAAALRGRQAVTAWIYACAKALGVQQNAKSHLLMAYSALQCGAREAAVAAIRDGMESGALRAGRLWEVAQPGFLLRLAEVGAVAWAEVPVLPAVAAEAVARERAWLRRGGRLLGGGLSAAGRERGLSAAGRERAVPGAGGGEGGAAAGGAAGGGGEGKAGSSAAAEPESGKLDEEPPQAPAAAAPDVDCYPHEVAVSPADLPAASTDGSSLASSSSGAPDPAPSAPWCPPDPGQAESAPALRMGAAAAGTAAASAPRFAPPAAWLEAVRGQPPPGSIEQALLPADADDRACLLAAAAAASSGDQKGSKHGAVLRISPAAERGGGKASGEADGAAGEGQGGSSGSSSAAGGSSGAGSMGGADSAAGPSDGEDVPAPLATPLTCGCVGFNHRFTPFPRAMRRLWREIGLGSKLPAAVGGAYDAGEEYAESLPGLPLKDPGEVDFQRVLDRGAPYQRWAIPGVLPEGSGYTHMRSLPFQPVDRPMLRLGNNSKIMHAEVHCLAQLRDIRQARGGEILICELDQLGIGYDTAIPCRMCNRALNQVGIGRIVYTSHAGLVEMTTKDNPKTICETLAMARG